MGYPQYFHGQRGFMQVFKADKVFLTTIRMNLVF